MEVDLTNPWLFGALVVALWVAMFVAAELLVLDGDVAGAVVRGVAGGLAFAIVYAYIQRE
ncbi:MULTISPECIES: hypothetical protein [unclassified Halobacterium]|jgi:hypothetical protein|uniref:hypothetical protein n=1 Tax=unclassified Halobacterium TaxID=2668073 RepID=UPI001E2C6305|nr:MULTISPECIES: hypothetical protein [unclassified Halobacterium]MCD2198407.1 hypothetical protein [Halobacterium sp. KA-4]MCD2202116.1 hypothetical protein [Halobacterium sp. KA-6]